MQRNFFFKLLSLKLYFFFDCTLRYWRYNIFIRIHNTRKSDRTISINLHAIFLTLKILRKIRSFDLAWTHVYFISLFLLSTLVTHIRYEVLSQLRPGSFTFTILFFYFYPVPSFNTCSRGNSIWKSYVAEIDRESRSPVYSSLFDPKG